MVNFDIVDTFFNDIGFEKIREYGIVQNGISFDTYKIILDDQSKYFLKTVKTKKDFPNIRKLKWEFEMQKSLSDVFPVPKQIFFCNEKGFQEPFTIAEYVEGNHKYDIKSLEKSFELLSILHKISLDNMPKEKIRLEKSIENVINKRYKMFNNFSKKENKNIEHMFLWMKKNLPSLGKMSIIHNDWQANNILFCNNKIVSVVDWELSSIGDYRLDFGYAFSYLKKGERDIIIDKLNIDFPDLKFFEVFGLFKLITIIELGKYKNIDDIIINNEKIENFIEEKIEDLVW